MKGKAYWIATLVMAALAWVAPGQTLYHETFETTVYPNLPSGWSQTPIVTSPAQVVCWKVVDKAHLWGESSTTLAFPSGTRALYFGKVDPNSGRGSYADGQNAVRGEALTGVIPLSGAKYIRISFYFLRVVEYYTGGHYDETLVEYRWYENQSPDNAWNKLWWKSSKDTQDTTWKQWASDPIKVPSGKTGIQIRFTFDSVDGQNNNLLGWLIDDLVVEKVPPPLVAELYRGGDPSQTTDRVLATVNTQLLDNYPQTGSYAIVISGGQPSSQGAYRYKLVEGYAFPKRIAFGTPKTISGTYCIPIVGVPEQPGSTYIEVRIEDYATPPNFIVLGFWIIINPEGQLRVYFEDFNQKVPPYALPP